MEEIEAVRDEPDADEWRQRERARHDTGPRVRGRRDDRDRREPAEQQRTPVERRPLARLVRPRVREVADSDDLWIEFVCLAFGYLLGMYQAGQCKESDCTLFEAQLPGFMWLHAERFVTVSDDETHPS